MDALRLDLQYALRNLRRRPGFAALAVLTLAIGIGVNAVAFAALNGLLYGPLRFTDVERLGWVMAGGMPNGSVSIAEFEDVRRGTHAFDAVGAMGRQPIAWTDDGSAGHAGNVQVWAQFVSAGYFPALDARAESGRMLDTGDDTRGDLVTVVSHRFWKQRMGGGSIAGGTLTLANRSVAVVGVVPDRFHGAGGTFAPDLWLPLAQIDALAMPARLRAPGERWLGVIARLAPGVTDVRANTELAALAPRLNGDVSRDAGSRGALRFHPMREGHPDVQNLAPMAWIALGAVGLVLLIACFNVAALLLARASERQREIGIRSALGAGRGRIVRQLMTEGLVLALLSGACAILVASWSSQLLAAFSLPSPIPQRLHMEIDQRLIGFTALLTLVAGVLPGLMPALQATRHSLVQSMRLDGVSGAASPSRARGILVVAQVAGSTAFLAVALLFARSLVNANAFEPGFDTVHTMVAQIDPARYGFEGRTAALAGALAARLSNTPGITAAVADRLPFSIGYPRETLVSTDTVDCSAGAFAAPKLGVNAASEGGPAAPKLGVNAASEGGPAAPKLGANAASEGGCRPTQEYAVGPRHFEVLGVAVRAGREFTMADLASGGAVIVSDTLARTLWPGRSPLGQTVALGRDRVPAVVVGVVADYRHRSFTQPFAPIVYRPYRESDLADTFTIVARTDGDRAALTDAIRETVRALAPAVPIASIATMTERLDGARWPVRTLAGLFLTCGVLALVLATVGLFGVTYYAVRQRTREFGIRIALGARPATVVAHVLRDGLRMAIPGAVLGLGAAAIAGRVLSGALLGVTAADPISFGSAAVVEVLVALLACVLPARRATEADPMAALRTE